jgi:ribulose 1,5-bisphosphate synthetase/thiazole synthase
MWPITSTLSKLAECQVLVVGAGAAGAVAAIAAARNGAKVLLVERYGFLGGTSTAILDTFYGFYTPGTQSKRVVAGVGSDVVARVNALSPVVERANTYGAGTGITYHPEYLKVTWEQLVKAAGARVLLHAWVQDAIVEGGRVSGVVLATKQGLAQIACDYVVDASGDADVCAHAGLRFELAGEHEPAQTLTTTFKMCNVDAARRKAVSKAEFHAKMAQAAEGGRYRLPRKEGSDHPMTVSGMIATVMTRVESFQKRDGVPINATDPWLLSDAEFQGRAQVLEYVRFLRDCIPGYERAELTGFSTQIGVRETRRVYGDYRLTRDDVMSARQFDDQIGLCGAPIEDHHGGADTKWQYLPDGQCVGIPFRTLMAAGAANVLVAGRCFSATHDAHASVRSMAQCMAMGQAAGTAAAMAGRRSILIRDLSFSELRDRLVRDGAILELPA